MIYIKTPEEIEIIRECGHRLAQVLYATRDKAVAGVSTKELDYFAEKMIRDMGDEPAFLGYRPEGAAVPFPATLCVSVNDEVVHGIPQPAKILKEGDIVSLDLGVKHKGLFTDMAVSKIIGKGRPEDVNLVSATEEALLEGIKAARAGNTVGDIGHAVESYVRTHKTKYGIVEVLAGHGVGKKIHEDPFIPNIGKPGRGEKLVPGMIIAIEPMLNLGTKNVTLDDDEYTIRTADGKKSAHFEHTILITESEPEILTMV